MAGSKLGVQVQNCRAIPGSWVQRHVKEGGVTHALLIDPDVLTADPWPGVKSMGRLVFNGNPDRPMIRKGAAGAREYCELCKPRWDKARWVVIWHPQCEPFTGNPEDPADLDPMRWLTEFSVELVRLAHIEGILMGVGVFSTGCPAGPRANPLPTIEAKWRIFAPAVAVADALVLHEYGMDTMEYTPENEWHIGHYKRGATVLRAESRRIPPIWVTEHFIDRAGNADTDGWRVKLNGDEAEAMRQLAMRDADYAADPLIEAVTPFTWLDYNWPAFTITESMSARIMAHRRTAGSLPEPEPEPVGALANGNFEDGFHYHNGANELYVPDSWTPFWADPPAKRFGDDVAHYDFRPEYKRCGGEATGPLRAVTGHGSQWFNTYAGHRAGIWQQVAATPGQRVTARATMMSWHSKDGHDDPAVSWAGKYAKRVGIDPTGGVDWRAASVVWSDASEVNDAWATLEASAVAQGAAVTVYVYGEPAYAYKHNNCYVDNVSVTLESPQEPPVPSIPYYHSDRQGSPIEYVILHDTEGSAEAARNWFRDPANTGRSSSHVIVTAEGAVWRIVPDELAAHHAGYGTIPGVTVNINRVTLGLELEYPAAPASPVWPEAQLAAAAAVVRAWCEQFGIPRERVLTHATVDPARRTDPRNFDLVRFLNRIWPPAVSIEQAISDAIQSHIIPLNPNAALEKAGAALGLLPASDEVRDVAGYVAQAFRSPGERQWQFVAYCADGDWGNVKWFKRAN